MSKERRIQAIKNRIEFINKTGRHKKVIESLKYKILLLQ